MPPSEGKKNANGKLVDYYNNSKRVLKKEKAAAASHSGSRFLEDSEGDYVCNPLRREIARVIIAAIYSFIEGVAAICIIWFPVYAINY